MAKKIYGEIFGNLQTDEYLCYGITTYMFQTYGFADNIGTTPYQNAGITLAKTNGYVSAFPDTMRNLIGCLCRVKH